MWRFERSLFQSAPYNKSLDASGGSVFRKLAWCGEGCFDSRRPVNSTVMRLINSSHQVITLRRLMAVTLLAGLTGCGSLVRPGSIKVADSTRAVADARKLIAEEREKPSKPM